MSVFDVTRAAWREVDCLWRPDGKNAHFKTNIPNASPLNLSDNNAM